MNIALLVKKSNYYHWDIYHVLLDTPFMEYEEVILAFNPATNWLDFHKASDYDFKENVFLHSKEFRRIANGVNFDLSLAKAGYKLIRSSTEL